MIPSASNRLPDTGRREAREQVLMIKGHPVFEPVLNLQFSGRAGDLMSIFELGVFAG
jgi:hypothetical protein